MSPTERFIGRFLANRNLSEPNGQRLHEYDCNRREYRDLVRILRNNGDPQHLRSPLVHHIPDINENENPDAFDTTDVMACFVLYASEWCRRWDDNRRRTWDRLLGHIHWKRTEYTQLYPAIVHGLNRWKRPVIRMPGSTRYFDTIAHEGDIPIEGFAVIEYGLISQDEKHAHYEPYYQPAGFQSGQIQVEKTTQEDAPNKIIGLFDTSATP